MSLQYAYTFGILNQHPLGNNLILIIGIFICDFFGTTCILGLGPIYYIDTLQPIPLIVLLGLIQKIFAVIISNVVQFILVRQIEYSNIIIMTPFIVTCITWFFGILFFCVRSALNKNNILRYGNIYTSLSDDMEVSYGTTETKLDEIVT